VVIVMDSTGKPGAQRQPPFANRQANRVQAFEKGNMGQVPLAHREALARAIGQLVAAIDKDKPKAGLKQIMDSLGPEKATTLAHRKRIVLLPEEKLPKGHVWAARWAEYLGFARLALALLANGKSGDVLTAYIERELARLIRIGCGADIAEGSVQAMSTSRLKSWATTIISRTIEGSNIEALWRELDSAPFTVTEADDTSGSDPLAAAAQAAETLPIPRKTFQHPRFTVVSRDYVRCRGSSFWHFGLIGPSPTDWAEPRIDLGWVCYPDHQAVFILPERFRDLMTVIEPCPGCLDLEAAPEALAWLESIGGGFDGETGWAPDIAYTEETGFGWFDNQFWALSRVSLVLAPGDDGAPTLFIEKEEASACIPALRLEHVEGDAFDFVERVIGSMQVSVSDFVPRFPDLTQLAITVGAKTALGVDEKMFHYKNGLGCMDRVTTGGAPGDLAPGEAPHWADTPPWFADIRASLTDRHDSTRDALLNRRGSPYCFYPSFAFDEARPAAAPAGSIAAALIANAHEPPERRLLTLLVERSKAIADAGMTYAKALGDYHEAAIQAM
jgi:hypothetical protein